MNIPTTTRENSQQPSKIIARQKKRARKDEKNDSCNESSRTCTSSCTPTDDADECAPAVWTIRQALDSALQSSVTAAAASSLASKSTTTSAKAIGIVIRMMMMTTGTTDSTSCTSLASSTTSSSCTTSISIDSITNTTLPRQIPATISAVIKQNEHNRSLHQKLQLPCYTQSHSNLKTHQKRRRRRRRKRYTSAGDIESSWKNCLPSSSDKRLRSRSEDIGIIRSSSPSLSETATDNNKKFSQWKNLDVTLSSSVAQVATVTTATSVQAASSSSSSSSASSLDIASPLMPFDIISNVVVRRRPSIKTAKKTLMESRNPQQKPTSKFSDDITCCVPERLLLKPWKTKNGNMDDHFNFCEIVGWSGRLQPCAIQNGFCRVTHQPQQKIQNQHNQQEQHQQWQEGFINLDHDTLRNELEADAIEHCNAAACCIHYEQSPGTFSDVDLCTPVM